MALDTYTDAETTTKSDRPYIPIYRLCKGCGTEWNVSIKEKGEGKHYYCPYCRAKISRGERLRKK